MVVKVLTEQVKMIVRKLQIKKSNNCLHLTLVMVKKSSKQGRQQRRSQNRLSLELRHRRVSS